MTNSASNTVLLVDDNPNDLYVYSRALTEAGYRLITTLIGTDVLGFHLLEKPALILLDAKPGSGLSAVTLAKLLHDIFPASPIVFFSMLAASPEMDRVTDGFLQKGDPQKLVAMVRGILSKGTDATEAAGAG